jgi:hypothetical protein
MDIEQTVFLHLSRLYDLNVHVFIERNELHTFSRVANLLFEIFLYHTSIIVL